MDSELDRTLNPFERNEEFEQFLDEFNAQQPDPEETDYENRLHDSKDK